MNARRASRRKASPTNFSGRFPTTGSSAFKPLAGGEQAGALSCLAPPSTIPRGGPRDGVRRQKPWMDQIGQCSERTGAPELEPEPELEPGGLLMASGSVLLIDNLFACACVCVCEAYLITSVITHSSGISLVARVVSTLFLNFRGRFTRARRTELRSPPRSFPYPPERESYRVGPKVSS